MRRRIFRLPHRLQLLLIAGPRAAGILLVREADKAAERRRTLLDQLSSYEAWWHAHQRLHLYSERAYEVALDHFLERHRELAQYRAWWIATRRDAMVTNALEIIVTDWARPANLRTPAWIGRYLEAVAPPAIPLPGNDRQNDETWPF